MNWENLWNPAGAIFKNPKISLWIGNNLVVQPNTNTQKSKFCINRCIRKNYILIWILLLIIRWVIYIKHNIRLFTFKMQHNKWDITANFKNLALDGKKHVFPWEKQNFEPFGNSGYKAGFLALGKALNIYIDYLMFYPSRQHVKRKHLQVQVYI